MASIKDSRDSFSIKFIKKQLDLFGVQVVSMRSACESIISSIKRLEEFKQESQNAPFITLQVNTSNLQAEFRNIFKEYHQTSMNALRTEILEEIRSSIKDLINDKSSDSVQDGATYTLSSEPEELFERPAQNHVEETIQAETSIDKTISIRNIQDTEAVARGSSDIADLPTKKMISISQKKPVSENENTDLEDEPQRKRCRSRNKAKQPNRNDKRARIADVDVELRCEELFERPAQNQVEETIQAETSIDKTISIRNIQDTEAVARGSSDIADLPTKKMISVSQKKRVSENENTDLEDEPQRKRCRSRNKAKQPNRNDERARIADVDVELRCESAAHDTMVIRTPKSTLLSGAVNARPGELSALFADGFDIPVEELFERPAQNIQDLTIQDSTIQEQDGQDQSAAHDRMVIRTPKSTLLTGAVTARPGELSALFADGFDIPVEELFERPAQNIQDLTIQDSTIQEQDGQDQSAAHDRMVIRTPESTLLTGAVTARPGELSALFADCCDIPVEGLFERPAQNQVEEIIQAETSIDKTISIRNIQDTEAVARESSDIADLPTKKQSISQKKRVSENEKTPKKRRAQLPSTLTRSADISRILSPNKVTKQSNTEHLTPMLQEASQSDFQPSLASAGIEPAKITQHERGTHGSEASKTPLDSLGRKKVITDSKSFIDYHWGVQGTMLKIFHCVVKGVPQITVESLLKRGPVIESLRRIIAARCFVSILKLRSNGFIKVINDIETKSIIHIELGPRITEGH